MKTYVICTRHPDASNYYDVTEGDEPGVVIHDIDLGASDLSQIGECIEWAVWHIDEAYAMPHAAKEHVLDVVWAQLWELGIPGDDLNRLLDEEREAQKHVPSRDERPWCDA